MPIRHVNCFIQPGLLPTNGLLVIGGEPGVGKSWMAQQMAFELACGRRVLGLFPCKQTKVAYLELEKRSDISQNRFLDYEWRKLYPEAPRFLGYYDERIPSMEKDSGKDMLENLIVEFAAEVIIVDSYAVTYIEEKDAVTIKPTIMNYRDIARTQKVSFILIHHLTKRGAMFDHKSREWSEEPIRLDTLRGNKVLHYEVDTAIGLAKTKKLERELGFLKHSFSTAPFSDLSPLKFGFNPGSAQPFRLVDRDMTKILELVDSGVVEYPELQSLANISRGTLDKKVDLLCEIKLLDKIESPGRKKSYVKLPKF